MPSSCSSFPCPQLSLLVVLCLPLLLASPASSAAAPNPLSLGQKRLYETGHRGASLR